MPPYIYLEKSCQNRLTNPCQLPIPKTEFSNFQNLLSIFDLSRIFFDWTPIFDFSQIASALGLALHSVQVLRFGSYGFISP